AHDADDHGECNAKAAVARAYALGAGWKIASLDRFRIQAFSEVGQDAIEIVFQFGQVALLSHAEQLVEQLYFVRAQFATVGVAADELEVLRCTDAHEAGLGFFDDAEIPPPC